MERGSIPAKSKLERMSWRNVYQDWKWSSWYTFSNPPSPFLPKTKSVQHLIHKTTVCSHIYFKYDPLIALSFPRICIWNSSEKNRLLQISLIILFKCKLKISANAIAVPWPIDMTVDWPLHSWSIGSDFQGIIFKPSYQVSS